MISLHLHDLIALVDNVHGENKALRPFLPTRFLELTTTIQDRIDPAGKSKARAEALEALADIEGLDTSQAAAGDGIELLPYIPRDHVSALADWCKENGEPWLERACKFILRHENVEIERYSYYSGCYRWRFKKKTMPERWQDEYAGSNLMAVLSHLAVEIKERLDALS
jgi:hypothetical protein